MKMQSELILASASSARARLLRAAGIDFMMQASGVDEAALKNKYQASECAAQYIAQDLADAKALAVSIERPDALVIGGDQTLALEDRLFDKPGDRSGAIQTLQALSGRTHQLPTAISIAFANKIIWRHLEVPNLTIRQLDLLEIESYLDQTGEAVYGCVGAYMIEGIGVQLFDRIDGDYFTIQGLPLVPLLSFLRAAEQ